MHGEARFSTEVLLVESSQLKRTRLLYERALFDGDGSALAAADRELDSVEADLALALARGRLIHGRFLEERNDDSEQAREDPRELALFEQAVHLYQAIGDVRGEAEALFWVGCCHQVVRRDNDAAVPVLERSLEMAAQAGDKMTMSEALRHLGIAGKPTGRADARRVRPGAAWLDGLGEVDRVAVRVLDVRDALAPGHVVRLAEHPAA
jgi:hypothetical protein